MADTKTSPLSRFELLPGEVKNIIYTYLFDPTINYRLKKYDVHPPTYPRKYVEGVGLSYRSINLSTALLRVNRRIYSEAHPILYHKHGPVIVVTGNRSSEWMDTLMASIGLEPVHTDRRASLSLNSIPSRIATVEYMHRRLKSAHEDDYDDGTWMDDHWSLVLVGMEEVRKFVLWVKAMNTKFNTWNEYLEITFKFQSPSDSTEEVSYLRLVQTALLDSFATINGSHIHQIVQGSLLDSASIAHYQIRRFRWTRAEKLNVLEAFTAIAYPDHIPKISGTQTKYSSLKRNGPRNYNADRFRYDFILHYQFIEGVIDCSHYAKYPIDTPDEVFPDYYLRRLFEVIRHNAVFSLAHTVMTQTKDIDEFYNQLPDWALQGTMHDYWSKLPELPGGSDDQRLEAEGYAQLGHYHLLRAIYRCYAVFNRRDFVEHSPWILERLEEAVSYYENASALGYPGVDGRGKATLKSLKRVLARQLVELDPVYLMYDDFMQEMPSEPMPFSVPKIGSSLYIAQEWTALKKQGYVGPWLEDRFHLASGWENAASHRSDSDSDG